MQIKAWQAAQEQAQQDAAAAASQHQAAMAAMLQQTELAKQEAEARHAAERALRCPDETPSCDHDAMCARCQPFWHANGGGHVKHALGSAYAWEPGAISAARS